MRVLLPTLCLIFGSVLLFQCKKDKDTPAAPSGVEVTITSDKTTVTFPSAGGNYEVKITSSGDWNVKEEIAWLEATKVDNTTLKVSCQQNTGASRSDKVTATIEGESVEITVTQSQPLGTLSTDRYTISSSEATNATLVLDVNFETAAAEWWLTGADGEAIPTFTSASPASDSKADVSSKTFTYSIGANGTGTAIPVSLELHISGETGGASLTMLPFTVTQGEALITALAPATFSVSEASAGSHTRTFTSLTLTGSATHWWLTGDASLPASVSLSPDKDDKKVPGTTTFTITLPRNETDQPRTYTLIFHAGSSVTPSDLALDVRSFTVTQPARLASVSSASLGTYHASGGDLTVDLSDADTGLSLTFENATSHYWWISQTDGTTSFSSGLTNVSPSVTRSQTDVSTLSFTLSPCTGTSDCSYDLMLNIATGMSAEATDQIPFTLTQSKALGSLSTMNYSLASGLASGETLTFTGLTFASEASEWWITGANGAAITAPLSSVSPDESSKAMLDQSNLPDGFTYSIGANAGTAREILLEIQIAAAAGEAPLTTLPFILTQDGTTLGVLATIKDTISADGATANYIFKGLVLNSGTHWWITKANGVAIGDSDLITNVRPDNDHRRTHDAEKSFTYTSSDNTGNSDIDINLEIQIAPSANADATTTLPFTMTQSKPLISAVGSNDGIDNTDLGTYTVTFSNRMFATGTTHWWITGSGANGALPAGVSVNVDVENKAPKSATTFNITVPENLTTSPQTFTLLLHAGTSGLAAEPSLHEKMFKVVQIGRLSSVTTTELGPYSMTGGNFTVDLSNSTSGLGLTFGDTSNDYWWISDRNGSTTFSSGLTTVSPSSTRGQTNATTLTFTLDPCTTSGGCDYALTLHVSTTANGASEEQADFVIHQGEALITALDNSYDITNAAAGEYTITLTGLTFDSKATHWWTTENGSLPEGASITPGTDAKKATNAAKTLTLTIPRNETTQAATYTFFLHAGKSATDTDPSLDVRAFTVTQPQRLASVSSAELVYGLGSRNYTIDLSDRNTGLGLTFEENNHYWWISDSNGGGVFLQVTGADPGVIRGKDRTNTTTLKFSLDRCRNPSGCRDVVLLNVATGANADPADQIRLTISQKPAVTLSGSYTIAADAAQAANINFGNQVEFRKGITRWWITGESQGAIPHSATVSATDGSRAEVTATAFTMNVFRNPAITDRSFILEVHAGGSSGSSEGFVRFTVTQTRAGSAATADLNKSTLEVAAIAGETTSVTLTVTQGALWRSAVTYPQNTPSWITSVTPDSQAGTGSAETLTIAYQANPSTSQRQATITFAVGDDTEELTITQPAASVGLSTTLLEVTEASGNENFTLTVTQNVSWSSVITYPSGPWNSDRVTLSKSSGTGTGSAEALTVTYPANTVSEERRATMTFTAGNVMTALTLVQEAAPVPAGLIPIRTLEQLDAMRYDLNTDGKADDDANSTAYATAFPKVVYNMNNTSKYTGYQLTKNLDFKTDASYSDADAHKSGWTSGTGWSPIGTFTGTFDGKGHTISHVFIDRTSGSPGLFGQVNGTIRNVGLVNPNVTGVGGNVGGLVAILATTSGTIIHCYVSGGSVTGGLRSGSLVGFQHDGTISSCYVSGGTRISEEAVVRVGGLVGLQNGGTISACYVSGGTNTGSGQISYVGGLVGLQQTNGTIRACYVFNTSSSAANLDGAMIGSQNGTIEASYAGGKNYNKLIGGVPGTVTNSYYQGGGGKTATALQTPTGYNTPADNIYKDWNLDLDGNAGGDDPWDFGTANQYPVLKIDVDLDGDVDRHDLAAQRPAEE